MVMGTGISTLVSRSRQRRQEHLTRVREMRHTRADVTRVLLSLSVEVAMAGGVAYVWWYRADDWAWVAIPFAGYAAFRGLILVSTLYMLARHRHPSQVPERAVCNECGKVKMPHHMKAHLRGSGHEASGWHLRED
jgi:hypothetical protein